MTALDTRRIEHRPVDLEGLRAAAQELAASGLQPRDIGALLSIGERAAAELLRWEGVPYMTPDAGGSTPVVFPAPAASETFSFPR